MKNKKPWYENNDFWRTVGPVLFRKSRWEMASEEVGHVISLLRIEPGAKVLDLCCGVGRHSIELARRGFKVTGVDITPHYLREARHKAKKAKLNIEFIKDDMRNFRRRNAYDVVINLFGSFGYFRDQRDDYRVAKNAYSSLKKNGSFIIELMGKEILARIFQKRDWYEIDDTIVLEERKTDKDWKRIESRWIIVKGKRKKEYTISLRLYSAVELSALLQSVGFRKIDVYGDLKGSPYDQVAKRLVVVAHRWREG